VNSSGVDMPKRVRAEGTWESYADAVRLFLRGATVPSAVRIALVVGTWLSLLNQGSAIADGDVPWVKVVLNYVTPFVVASLGYLAARRRRNVERLVTLLADDGQAASGNAPMSMP
jgi:hypothetical protein